MAIEYHDSDGMSFRVIPPGAFMMTATDREVQSDAHPAQRTVSITKPFYLATHETTQATWETVMDTRPWSGKGNVKEGRDYPAVQISWHDAVEFCRRLSHKTGKCYRLPTEAEWEFACRAGTTTAYHFGDDEASLESHAWSGWTPLGGHVFAKDGHPREVGLKQPNPFGLYDMHGNVAEWCADRYRGEAYPQQNDPNGPGPDHVIRGGSWNDDAWP
ncbi:MAG: formylglycine-generating enzyme family protein, partial [Patescibacteria group bacterium]|nr:formylglycine-generating enzyme family protein [Patescibacteria group bacterium]